jgi:hypothetical protein
VRQGFSPRGWPEVTADFLAKLGEVSALPRPQRAPVEAPALAPGIALAFPPPEGEWSPLLALGPGFEAPMPEGAPLAGGAASLVLSAAAPVTLLLRFAAADWAAGNRLGVALGEGPPAWHGVAPGGALTVRLALPAGESEIALLVSGPLEPPTEVADRRPIRLWLRGIEALPAEPAALPPRRALAFDAASLGAAAAGTLAEGWDHAAGPDGVAPLSAAPVLRFAPEGLAPGERLRAVLRFALAEGAQGVLRHPGGETAIPRGAAALSLPLALEVGADGRVEIALAMAGGEVPPLRLAGLQWAAEADVEGRLALLEAVLLPGPGGEGPPPERLARAEAALAPGAGAALPPGAAGRAARRLLGG